MLKIQEQELKSDQNCQYFFQFISLMDLDPSQCTKELSSSEPGEQAHKSHGHTALSVQPQHPPAIHGPKTRCSTGSSTYPIPSTQQPLCKYCLFPVCILIVPALQAALAREAGDLSWGSRANILSPGLQSDHLSQPLSRQCPEPSLTHRGSTPTAQQLRCCYKNDWQS